MKLDDIINEWDIDCQIDFGNLITEATKVAELHNKYYKIFLIESKTLREVQEKYNKIQYEKWLYYSGKMDKADLEARGWQPCDIMFLKGDVQRVMDADDDLIKMKLAVGIQSDKVKYLNDIIGVINKRTFSIGHAIDLKKMELGIS